MTRGLIALLATGAALVAPAHAQREQVVLARTVFAMHRVPAKTVTSFTVACGRGSVAASAGVSRPGPGTSVVAIRPVGARAYRVRVANPAHNGPQRVTVALACLSLAPVDTTRYSLRLTTVKKQAVAPGRKTTGRSLACPAGTVPAGGGVELGRSLALRRQTSSLSSFSFSAQNAGPKAKRVVFYGTCLTLARAADTPRRRLHVNVSTFQVPVEPGKQTINRRCRSGWFPLAAGYQVRSKLTQVDGAAAVGPGGRWSLTSDAEQATTAELQLACGKLGA